MALIRSPAVSRTEAERLVNETKWFHSVEIIDGLVTPGITYRARPLDAAQYIDSLGLGLDLSGVRILDIGTYDGPMAFELAQRGADVVAVDIKRPDVTGFNTMKVISGIDIPHVQTDVCELTRHFSKEFDIVLFLGVFYHLKYPIMAFENIAEIIKVGGFVYTEGESFARYFEDITGAPVALENVEQIFASLEALDKAGVPVAMAYPSTYMRGYNWFLPNASALRGWLQITGFTVEHIEYGNTPTNSRRVRARARRNP